jgi:tetratricopeptide (TPR) repeat protein
MPSAPANLIDDLSAALALHRAGRLAEAEAGYHRILDADPGQPLTLHLLGVLMLASGRAGEAVAVLRQAEAARPGNADTRLALADACAAAGATEEAIGRYRAILAERPGHAATLVNYANALRDAGDHSGAIEACRRAVSLAPVMIQAHITLGSALLAAGESDAAVAAYRAAVSLCPDSAPAHAGYAAALLRAGDPAAALVAAVRAIELAPALAEAWFVRGAALRALRRFEAAIDALSRAVEIEPGHARAHLALGNAHLDLDRLACGEHHLRTAIALDRTLPEAHASLGFLLAGCGRLDEAATACATAIRLRPDFARAHWNLSFALLLAGDFERGWNEYEWRKRHDRFAPDFLSLPGREWEGEPLAGQTLLVHAEQGLGDTIQFARYLPLLAERGARVVLACVQALIPLLEKMPGVASAVPKTGALPAYDFWVDQMSLPRLFRTRPDTIPAPAGYLHADPARVAAWTPASPARPRVGIVWAGNPEHSNDSRRSMSVDALAPIMAVPGIEWISLQVGPASSEITARFGIADQSAALIDFAETAALVATLDLVIAVDTSAAHLAGAMGKRVWVMIPFAPHWRWMAGRDDSPWYHSLRLFRQTAPGDWGGIARRAAEALAERYSAPARLDARDAGVSGGLRRAQSHAWQT